MRSKAPATGMGVAILFASEDTSMKAKKIIKMAENGWKDAAKVASKKVKKVGNNVVPWGDLAAMNFDLKDLGKTGRKANKLIRRNPAKAILLAVGLGYFLGKAGDNFDIRDFFGDSDTDSNEKKAA
jgi:hypothetical protein